MRTREAIRQATYRLVQEQGYDATTVEQIAEAAEVSPSTVFRYFPTKEDIILSDEYDPLLADAIRARPADEPPLVALRRAMTDVMRLLWEQVTEEVGVRLRLIRAVPQLRARMLEGMDTSTETLLPVLAERSGRPVDDFELRVVVGAVMGALMQALFDWVDRGGTDDLSETVDRALEVLERGLEL
ncbi:TetR family transcriptional regulator [Streptomyces sp. A7024]|uniref:TetR family transcriptional regulator n=1 Tax=Streptomyces coryli TaxID=1128680 RepID=A0A6G4TV52_9ACTN|nr:TetR family transcriptional regulator [Streptomyces coryli]